MGLFCRVGRFRPVCAACPPVLSCAPPARGNQARSMRHRILQYEGRRYSLKLDTIMWEILEELVERSDLRLNELVARVAEDVGDDAGVTGALRLDCLKEIRQR